MNIYLIRHGQSLWQARQTMDPDSELTALGSKQAQYLNDYVNQIIKKEPNEFSIYVSPLKRAIQTVYGLNQHYVLKPDIIEASFHIASSLPQFDRPKLHARKISKEPSYKKFKLHIKKTMKTIISTESNKSIYLYTHGGVIKTFLRIIHDNDNVCYAINNCSITHISWKSSRWHIHTLNEISFLPKHYVT